MSERAAELLTAALGAITVLAGIVAALVRFLPGRRPEEAAPPPAPLNLQELVVKAVDLGQLKAAVETLATEVEKLRDWRHDIASDLGAVRMVGVIMRRVNDVRVRVARLEGLEGRRP